MRLGATESERRLQEEIRGFLAEEGLDAAGLPRSLDERMDALRAWQARCYEAGYVGRAWPREFGGGGGPAAEQIVIDQELAAAGAPEFANVVGLDVLGPSLLRFGTDEQRRRYMPRSWPRRRSGARGSRSRTPARTSRRCGRAPRTAAITSSSAARRPGSRGGSSRAGAACWRGPTTPGRSTAESRC
jgi:Acyl-CoA dehydrogenase, N-terminal domain